MNCYRFISIHVYWAFFFLIIFLSGFLIIFFSFFPKFSRNLISNSFYLSNRLFWQITILSKSCLDLFDLIYMRLILPLIMAYLYLELTLVVFLLYLLNLIHQKFLAASTGCCFTGLTGNSCLRPALLLVWVTLSDRRISLTESISPCKWQLRRASVEVILSRWKLRLQPQDNLTRCICCTFNYRRIFRIWCYDVGGILLRILLLCSCLLNVETLLYRGLQRLRVPILLYWRFRMLIFFWRQANCLECLFVNIRSLFLNVMRLSLYFFALHLILFHAPSKAIVVVILSWFSLAHRITNSFIIFSLTK